MAEQDFSILCAEENGVEFFTDTKTGRSGLNGRGIAKSLGVADSSISRLEKKVVSAVLRESLPASLQPLWGKALRFCAKGKGNQKIYSSDTWACFAEYFAFESEHKTKEAIAVYRSFARIGAESFIQSKTGWLPEQYKAAPQAHKEVNRILDTPSPWQRMYEPEFCKKAFSMFGSSFYWQFCYSWMTQEEQCKVNRVNPLVNGKRDARIHQFLDTDTRKRLTPYVAEMVVLIDVANSKEEFSKLYARRYGANQLNLL